MELIFMFVHFGDREQGANTFFSARPSFVSVILSLLLGLGQGVDFALDFASVWTMKSIARCISSLVMTYMPLLNGK
jgi:hypothetical protein